MKLILPVLFANLLALQFSTAQNPVKVIKHTYRPDFRSILTGRPVAELCQEIRANGLRLVGQPDDSLESKLRKVVDRFRNVPLEEMRIGGHVSSKYDSANLTLLGFFSQTLAGEYLFVTDEILNAKSQTVMCLDRLTTIELAGNAQDSRLVGYFCREADLFNMKNCQQCVSIEKSTTYKGHSSAKPATRQDFYSFSVKVSFINENRSTTLSVFDIGDPEVEKEHFLYQWIESSARGKREWLVFDGKVMFSR